MPAEPEMTSLGPTSVSRRRSLLLAGATGLALADILSHADLSLAKKNKNKNKKNKHKKCKKSCKKVKKNCNKVCESESGDVDFCKNECGIAQKQCKKVC